MGSPSLLRFALPLMASGVLMSVEWPLLNMGMARLPHPELYLAAFGLAFSLGVLYESPIIILLDTSVAISRDWPSYLMMRRFTLWLLGVTIAVGLLLFWTPLYDLITKTLMGIPPHIAEAARWPMRILMAWPIPIGWRRLHQGVLIRLGQTRPIIVGTSARILLVIGILLAGAVMGVQNSALLGSAALLAGVTLESVLITLAANPAMHTGLRRAAGETVPTFRQLWQFYQPLGMTILIQQFSRPVITAGIAASARPELSLAAWPVALSVTGLLTGPLWSLQQITVALSDEPERQRDVHRFALIMGAIVCALLLLVSLTPLASLVLVGVLGVSTPVRDVAVWGLRILALQPIGLALQNFLRGVLIHAGHTVEVRRAMVSGVVAICAVVGLGVVTRALPGLALGALSLLAGVAVETWRLALAAARTAGIRAIPATAAGFDRPEGGAYNPGRMGDDEDE
ncbi:MAG: hypothetical protein HY660_02710 [Armatimonadetes bacterium]|nr:hypothetical protein [Armatimonadota bacterium]